jgi:hypothetical protein
VRSTPLFRPFTEAVTGLLTGVQRQGAFPPARQSSAGVWSRSPGCTAGGGVSSVVIGLLTGVRRQAGHSPWPATLRWGVVPLPWSHGGGRGHIRDWTGFQNRSSLSISRAGLSACPLLIRCCPYTQTWDYENRLTQVTKTGLTATYVYRCCCMSNRKMCGAEAV